jgi:hypothetical protein
LLINEQKRGSDEIKTHLSNGEINAEISTTDESELDIYNVTEEKQKFVQIFEEKIHIVDDFFKTKIEELDGEFEKLKKTMGKKKSYVV